MPSFPRKGNGACAYSGTNISWLRFTWVYRRTLQFLKPTFAPPILAAFIVIFRTEISSRHIFDLEDNIGAFFRDATIDGVPIAVKQRGLCTGSKCTAWAVPASDQQPEACTSNGIEATCRRSTSARTPRHLESQGLSAQRGETYVRCALPADESENGSQGLRNQAHGHPPRAGSDYWINPGLQNTGVLGYLLNWG